MLSYVKSISYGQTYVCKLLILRRRFVLSDTLLASSFRTRAALQAEILALRHQLAVFQRTRRVACASTAATGSCGLCCTDSGPVGGDVSRWFSPTRSSVGTAELSPGIGPGNPAAFPGRPEVAANIRDLIRRMRQANPLWGAPRIHGELLKLGIAVAQSTVARYLPRPRKPKDTPEHRAVEQPEQGHVLSIPQVGGLHHRYLRRAA